MDSCSAGHRGCFERFRSEGHAGRASTRGRRFADASFGSSDPDRRIGPLDLGDLASGFLRDRCSPSWVFRRPGCSI